MNFEIYKLANSFDISRMENLGASQQEPQNAVVFCKHFGYSSDSIFLLVNTDQGVVPLFQRSLQAEKGSQADYEDVDETLDRICDPGRTGNELASPVDLRNFDRHSVRSFASGHTECASEASKRSVRLGA